MIFLITVIYFVTWVPLMVFQCFPAWLIMALFQNKAGFTIVYLLTLTLNVNHAINPIVYSFVNVRFRRECKATSVMDETRLVRETDVRKGDVRIPEAEKGQSSGPSTHLFESSRVPTAHETKKPMRPTT